MQSELLGRVRCLPDTCNGMEEEDKTAVDRSMYVEGRTYVLRRRQMLRGTGLIFADTVVHEKIMTASPAYNSILMRK